MRFMSTVRRYTDRVWSAGPAPGYNGATGARDGCGPSLWRIGGGEQSNLDGSFCLENPFSQPAAMNEKVVYLMRGLPCCGKSKMAKKLVGDDGVICETDEYFYTHVGDDPTRYDYRADLMEAARRWNFQRFREAVNAGISPIIVDRGNGLSLESQLYARYALDRGYQVQLKEPESQWWQEIRALLEHKRSNKEILYQWADRLAEASRRNQHRVPASTIRRRMDHWQHDLTVEEEKG